MISCVDSMVDDVVGGRINFGIGIVIDITGELCELAIEVLLPPTHGFGKKGFNKDGLVFALPMASSCWVVASRAGAPRASALEGGFIGVQFIDTSYVGYKVNLSSENVK